MIDLSTVHAPDEPPHPDCPHGDPMHDHGDGCPSCDIEQCPACRCIRGKLAAGEECPGVCQARVTARDAASEPEPPHKEWPDGIDF